MTSVARYAPVELHRRIAGEGRSGVGHDLAVAHANQALRESPDLLGVRDPDEGLRVLAVELDQRS